MHLREQGLIGMEDPDIVAKARNEGRIVLTFDLDLGEIMALSGPGCFKLSKECQVTVEDHGYRLRRLPMELRNHNSLARAIRVCRKRT